METVLKARHGNRTYVHGIFHALSSLNSMKINTTKGDAIWQHPRNLRENLEFDLCSLDHFSFISPTVPYAHI